MLNLIHFTFSFHTPFLIVLALNKYCILYKEPVNNDDGSDGNVHANNDDTVKEGKCLLEGSEKMDVDYKNTPLRVLHITLVVITSNYHV